MRNFIYKIRNSCFAQFYRFLMKPIFFRFDPEKVHDRMVGMGKLLGRFRLGRFLTWVQFGFGHKMLEQEILGLKFRNPIGLSAGFDKNAELLEIMPAVGFGFEEFGSITGIQCAGNARPRLWRLPKSKALAVYYGLKNDGADSIAARLGKWWIEHKKNVRKRSFIYGVSLAKTNCKETVDDAAAIDDYLKGYLAFKEIGDYFTINISCPNAYGGQPFTDGHKLRKLLTVLDKYYIPGKPVFIKFSPDLSQKEIRELVEICLQHKVDGFVCTNLTKKRDLPEIKDKKVPEMGGLSGKIVQKMSDQMIEEVFRLTRGKKIIIGSGGVFSAKDAYRKIRKGASLIQLITGMIFQGPQLISSINIGLVELLKKDGFKSIDEAVGVDVI